MSAVQNINAEYACQLFNLVLYSGVSVELMSSLRDTRTLTFDFIHYIVVLHAQQSNCCSAHAHRQTLKID